MIDIKDHSDHLKRSKDHAAGAPGLFLLHPQGDRSGPRREIGDQEGTRSLNTQRGRAALTARDERYAWYENLHPLPDHRQ
jgi:hypothetical protein